MIFVVENRVLSWPPVTCLAFGYTNVIFGSARSWYAPSANRCLVEILMPVRMQLSRIIISEISEQQVIYLKEVDGNRQFPIFIGIFEATSIDRRVKGRSNTRPLTHDLIVKVVDSMDAVFHSVVISELRDHTYFAKLIIKRSDGEQIEIDSRPSDAIAIAVTCDPRLPVYVAEDVLEEAIGRSN